jgi:hypothetical protein
MPATYHKLESLVEVAAVNALPFTNPYNQGNIYYQKGEEGSAGWICSDRPHIIHSDDVPKALAEPLFPAGVARIERLLSDITAPAPQSRRRRPRRSDQGDDLDMSRVWQGDLEHAWTQVKREQAVGPARVLIVVDIAASASTSSDSMALRGAAALALATALQASGYTVSITAIAQSELIEHERTLATTEITVLEPGQEIDLHKLANLLASALLFRGVVLDHNLRTAKNKLAGGIGYRPSTPQEKVADTTGYDKVCTITRFGSTTEARDWVANEIKKLGEIS